MLIIGIGYNGILQEAVGGWISIMVEAVFSSFFCTKVGMNLAFVYFMKINSV
jgi:hypothetical protein